MVCLLLLFIFVCFKKLWYAWNIIHQYCKLFAAMTWGAETCIKYQNGLKSQLNNHDDENASRDVNIYWYDDSSVLPRPVSCPVESRDNTACDCRMFLWDERYHWGIMVLYCRLQCQRISICSASEKVRQQLDSLAQCHSSRRPPHSWPECTGSFKKSGTATFLSKKLGSINIF